MEKVKLLEDYDHNTIINKLMNNNAFIMQEDYEHMWLPHFKHTITGYLMDMNIRADKASNINDLYNLFDTKGFSNTQRLLYKQVFRPNAYMRAVLQTLADLGCCAAKKIRQLYRDEIKKWDDARMYDAFNALLDSYFISTELLLYTGPTKVKIWKAPFYSQEQYAKAIEIYEAQRISYEERQKKKELVITHNYNKAPEKKIKSTSVISTDIKILDKVDEKYQEKQKKIKEERRKALIARGPIKQEDARRLSQGKGGIK